MMTSYVTPQHVRRSPYLERLQSDLQQLDDLIDLKTPIINLYGLTGIGKTVLCEQAFELFKAEYAVVFISFDTDDQQHKYRLSDAITLLRTILPLAQLTSPIENTGEVETISCRFDAALDRQHYKPLLFLLDGLDDLRIWKWVQQQVIKPLIELHRTLVVCTSQASIGWHFWELQDRRDELELIPFTVEETAGFLDMPSDNALVHTLYSITLGYPLGLEIVLSIINERNSKQHSFLTGGELVTYRRNVLQALSKRLPAQRLPRQLQLNFEVLLQSMAAPTRLFTPAELYRRMCGHEELARTLKQGFIIDAMTFLCSRGVIIDKGQKRYQLHVLIKHLVTDVIPVGRHPMVSEQAPRTSALEDSDMNAFIGLTTYIGREQHKQSLIRWSQTIMTEARCWVLYFEAEGGLGKTRLLEQYPSFVREHIPGMLIAHTVDLYDYESRNPDTIEQKLIVGLKQTHPDQWYYLPPDTVDEVFRDYYNAYGDYLRQREYSTGTSIQAEQLRQIFVTCWNRLAQKCPLVIRFDTVETLFREPAPPQALIQADEATTGVGLIIDWIRAVLPQLHHTLVLFSGRPIKDRSNLLIELLQDLELLAEPVQVVKPFSDDQIIQSYLKEYQVDVLANELPWIREITGGQPLLLTCLAETRRAHVELVRPDHLTNKAEFEEQLVQSIFNPMRYTDPGMRTIIYSLYFLAYARRGLTLSNLRSLFDLLGLERNDQQIDQLNRLALIKTVRSWNETLPTAKTIAASVNQEQLLSEDVLLLHDEIYQLIDEKGGAEDLGLTVQTLDYLCDVGKQQVQQAMEGTALLKAMSEHMYYELTRDIKAGYRSYTIYIDWLLRERSINAALVLSDVFWSTLNYCVVNRNDQSIYPYKERLAASDLKMDAILRDEQVRKVKLLHARGNNSEAMDLASQLSTQFANDGLLPLDPIHASISTIQDQYLFVDLNLTRAIAITLARPQNYEHLVEPLFTQIIKMLENPDELNNEFLRLRRCYSLGLAYTLRGQLYYEQRLINESIADASKGHTAFKKYLERTLDEQASPAEQLNDRIDTDIGQVVNNLAYNMAINGNVNRARSLSNEVIERYSAKVSNYRRALFYCTNVRIRSRVGEYLEAQISLREAESAAYNSGINRAIGLVEHATAQLKRSIMVASQEINVGIRTHYQRAVDLLKEEHNTLRDVYYDWARFERDLAGLHQKLNNVEQARICAYESLKLIDELLKLYVDEPSAQHADLLQAKATTYSLIGEYAEAIQKLDEADEIMKNLSTIPAKGQVICGRIALQRASIELYYYKEPGAALRQMAIALTRAYLFARRHLDQKIFEQLIGKWIKDIAEDDLRIFQQITEEDEEPGDIADDDISTLQQPIKKRVWREEAADLPYHPPADSARWDHEWNYSVNFINDCINNHLDI